MNEEKSEKRGLNSENYKRKLLFLMAIVNTTPTSISELYLSLNVSKGVEDIVEM